MSDLIIRRHNTRVLYKRYSIIRVCKHERKYFLPCFSRIILQSMFMRYDFLLIPYCKKTKKVIQISIRIHSLIIRIYICAYLYSESEV